MIKFKIFKILAYTLIISSLAIGFMLDCGHFIENIEYAVVSSFSMFMIGMTILIYVNEKTK